MVNRIKKVIEKSGKSDSSFAKLIGLQQMTLWRQLNGERKLSLETVTAVLSVFPEISAEWLLRGEGSMLIGDDNAAQDKRIEKLVDVIAMQQEVIQNLQEKIKQLQNQ